MAEALEAVSEPDRWSRLTGPDGASAAKTEALAVAGSGVRNGLASVRALLDLPDQLAIRVPGQGCRELGIGTVEACGLVFSSESATSREYLKVPGQGVVHQIAAVDVAMMVAAW